MTNRKIYSCSLFFNEHDLLRIKVETLKNVVDGFVFCEGKKTHSGKDKVLNFPINAEWLQPVNCIYHPIYNTPDDYTNLNLDNYNDPNVKLVVNKLISHTHWPKNVSSYGRDSFEKESLIIPLLEQGVRDQDIVTISDLDEIVSPEKLIDMIEHFDDSQVYHFEHDVYYYGFNIRKNETWYGTLACSFKTFKENSFCVMRNFKHGVFVHQAGQHFTYQNRIKEKLEAFGEQSLNQDWVKDDLENKVKNCLTLGVDLFNRPCKMWRVPVTYETHPRYLVDHLEDYKEYIL